MSERDYSGTPLATKVGAKPGAHDVVYFTIAFDDDWSAVRFAYRKEP